MANCFVAETRYAGSIGTAAAILRELALRGVHPKGSKSEGGRERVPQQPYLMGTIEVERIDEYSTVQRHRSIRPSLTFSDRPGLPWVTKSTPGPRACPENLFRQSARNR